MNLTERAEIRKETYYKLTNSADAPEVPSGNRNLYALSKNAGIYTRDITDFVQNVETGEISFKVTGIDPFFGIHTNKGVQYDTSRGIKIPVKKDESIAIYVSNEELSRSYVSFFGNDDISVKNFEFYNTNKFVISAEKLIDVSYITLRSGLEYDNNDAGKTLSTKIKVEYGNAATPYSQAPEDLGWFSATLVPTQSNRYLWKFEYIYYSDGSVEVTQPTNISIAGADGTNGQTSHVHFAFADNATGGGFSLTTPKAYMGWYADFNEAASTDPTKYRWSKWKGDQGLPGKPGDDGKTSYFHMAYADSADGRTGFSFKESGQQYQGYYTDFTQSSSTDPTKYTWMDRRAGVEVGGVNLLHNSKGPFQPKGSRIDNHVTYSNAWISMEKGKEYTLSAKGTAPFTGSHAADKEKNEICLWLVKHDENINVDRIISSSSTGNGGTKFTWNDPSGKYYLRVNTYKIDNSNFAEDVQIEEGNIKTTYTRNPDDIQSDIDSKADQTLTQEQLNALEAKRLQMETEMKALATLQQVSELETFINNLKKEDLDGRQKIIEITKAIEERVKDIEPIMEYSQKLKFMDTYITQGNGGMIIGANESTTKVVVTPDRISFQSGGSEVAYISQRMLHIDNGVFTMSLQLGHYITRAHPRNEYVNATYFVK